MHDDEIRKLLGSNFALRRLLPHGTGWVDSRGRPTHRGEEALREMRKAIDVILRGDHEDNCGPGCRVDLDGHDCCYTCNLVEAMLRAASHEGVL
jgi:hypothetical protein